MIQDSPNHVHTCELKVGNRNAPKHPVLSMAYTQIGINNTVTSKSSGSTNQLWKTTHIQAGIHMKTLQAHACCQDKQRDGVVQQLM